MNARNCPLGWSTLAALTFALVGCETSPTPPPTDAPSATKSPQDAARAADAKADAEAKGKNDIKSMPIDPGKPDTKGASAEKLTDDEVAAIKKLPADDQPLAMAQMVCPVSDGHLGAMGKPLKETADGKTVFVCCDNCVDPLKADPAKYLAKLEKK